MHSPHLQFENEARLSVQIVDKNLAVDKKKFTAHSRLTIRVSIPYVPSVIAAPFGTLAACEVGQTRFI